MREPAEAFAEAACVARRVAEHGPDDLRVAVSHRPFGGLPDDVRDGGRLVEQHEHAATLVVQTCERLGVLFRPRDLIDAPCTFVFWIDGVDRRRAEREPVLADAEAMP